MLPFTKGFGDAWGFVGDDGGRFFFQTDKDAPLNRLVAVPAGRLDAAPVEVDRRRARTSCRRRPLVAHRLVLVRLKNASDRALRPRPRRPRWSARSRCPRSGSIGEITRRGRRRRDVPRLHVLHLPAHAVPLLVQGRDAGRVREGRGHGGQRRLRGGAGLVPVEGRHAASRCSWCTSKGLPRDGQRPTLLSGYGGFNVRHHAVLQLRATSSGWSTAGSCAIANLRGGGEYGEAWHQAGMLERKQNVFDDFIAAAEWLIKSGYTRRERLAIQGGSNGGLLVGAVMVAAARPLRRRGLPGPGGGHAALPPVHRRPLLDPGVRLRGRTRRSSRSSTGIRRTTTSRTASPTRPTLVTTADTDDRVAPGPGQEVRAPGCRRPRRATRRSSIRVETKAGHGAGKPISKQIDEQADIYTFLFWQLGVPLVDHRAGRGRPLRSRSIAPSSRATAFAPTARSCCPGVTTHANFPSRTSARPLGCWGAGLAFSARSSALA